MVRHADANNVPGINWECVLESVKANVAKRASVSGLRATPAKWFGRSMEARTKT